MHQATIDETKRQLALVEQQTEELLLKIKPHAGGQTAYLQATTGPVQQPQVAPPHATLIPVLPGDIVHSSHINQKEMIEKVTLIPNLQKLGLAGDDLTALSTMIVQNLLCQMQEKTMTVAEPSQTAAPEPHQQQQHQQQPLSSQPVSMEADAETKRKAEEIDGDMTDESTDSEEKNDLDTLNNREEGKPPEGKRKVNREDKKDKKTNGKAAVKPATALVKK